MAAYTLPEGFTDFDMFTFGTALLVGGKWAGRNICAKIKVTGHPGGSWIRSRIKVKKVETLHQYQRIKRYIINVTPRMSSIVPVYSCKPQSINQTFSNKYSFTTHNVAYCVYAILVKKYIADIVGGVTYTHV